MKMGFTSFSFPKEVPIETIIESVKKNRFQGLEVSAWKGYQADIARLTTTDWRRIKRLSDETDLEIPAIGCHQGYTSPDPSARTEAIDRTKRCIEAASNIDVDVVVTLSGGLQMGQSFDQAWSLMISAVAQIIDYASQHDVAVAFEAHIGHIVDSFENMLRLMREVPSRYLKINFDASQFSIRGWDVPASVKKTAEHIIYTHFKDTKCIVPDFQFLIPGEGDFEIKSFLIALNEVGYDGYVTTEISVMRSSKPDYDPQQALKLSYETVSRAFREAGLVIPSK